MENYYNPSYPESGGSSPRSREIDFENTPPWEDSQNNQLPPNYKVKFMCSYGGKIHPRPNDNQLSYIGGDTKILAVDRNIKFNSLLSKLMMLSDSDNISFKYQLPGEDLDALISVTSDDDLDHMMTEYDRLYRVSPKPSRLRIFIFTAVPNQSSASSVRSFGSEDGKSEKDRFVEALNSGPVLTAPPPVAVTAVSPQPPPATSNMDYLFGLEKGAGIAPQAMQAKVEIDDRYEERSMGADPIQQHIRDLERLRIEEQQRRRSEDNLGGGYAGGDYYKVPEKLPPVSVPGGPPGYWPEKQFSGGGQPVFPTSNLNTEQQIYMIPAHGGAYHAPPMMRQVTAPPGQGYYAVQRMPDQQMYNAMPSAAMAPQTLPQQAAAAPPPKMSGYSEGFGMVRPVADAGYGQFAYDTGMGRQVMYTAQGGVMAAPPGMPPMQQAQFQAMGGVTGEMRQVAAHNQESGGKVVTKVTQNSV